MKITKKKVITTIALTTAIMTARHADIEKSYTYKDNDGHSIELCATVNHDYVSFERYIDGDRNDAFFAGVVRHDADGYKWQTWDFELSRNVDSNFLLVKIGPF